MKLVHFAGGSDGHYFCGGVFLAARQRVVLSHSEILKPEEEGRVLRVVMDPSVGLQQARASFGRFTQAKLELAAQSADFSASVRAAALLTELRNR